MSSPLDRPQERPEEANSGTAARKPIAAAWQPAASAAGTASVRPLLQRPDSGLVALASIAGQYRIAADPYQLAHDLGLGARAASGQDIVRAATRLGLKARALPNGQPKRLSSAPTPAILRMDVTQDY